MEQEYLLPGNIRTIRATDKTPDYDFVNWTGDIEELTDPNSAVTTVTMGNQDVTVNANYIFAGLNCMEYGLLYNWFAATDARGIAPVGWHVPTDTEIATLRTTAGGASTAGNALKELGTTYWDTIGGTNYYGFSARGSGSRSSDGNTFTSLHSLFLMFSATPNGNTFAGGCRMYSTTGAMDVTYTFYKKAGLAVRLIKDSSVDTGTMTDFDGNVYPTIKIGNQVWMAANLQVTHYNDGSVIPQITDNTQWAALTTGAMCAYNNDWDNVDCKMPGYDLITEFLTNSGSATTFDPSITKSSGDFAWDLGDGTLVYGDLAISHTYADSSTKTVKLYGKNTPQITLIDWQSDNIVGELNLSHDAFKYCGSITLNSNSSLISIRFPNLVTTGLSTLYIQSCNLTGTLNLTAFTTLNNATISVPSNPLLTGISFPSSPVIGLLTSIYANNCNITGNLNISCFTTMSTSLNGTTIQFNSNPSLISITFPTSYTGKLATLNFSSCNITGNLDLSACFAWGVSGQIIFSSNPLLTSVTYPSSFTGTFNNIYFNNCGLTGNFDLSKFTTLTAAANIIINNNAITGFTLASSISGKIESFFVNLCNLTGNVDVSKLTAMSASGTFYFNNNPLLTGVTFAPSYSSGVLHSLAIFECGLTNTLDLSMFTAFSSSCSINAQKNSNLTEVIFASSISGSLFTLALNECNLTGTLDLSKITSLNAGANISVQNNANLTGVTFAVTITGTLASFRGYSTGITSINLSSFKTFSTLATIDISTCNSITSITLSSTTTAGNIKTFTIMNDPSLGYVDFLSYATSINVASTAWRIDGNSWAAAIVNHVLVDLNSIATAGFAGRSINIGGTNADPDNSSGGYDGIAARNSLIAKGFTVNI